MEWISVEDRLPKKATPVLVTNGVNMGMRERQGDEYYQYWTPASYHHAWDGIDVFQEFDDVTHWTVPELPTKD